MEALEWLHRFSYFGLSWLQSLVSLSLFNMICAASSPFDSRRHHLHPHPLFSRVSCFQCLFLRKEKVLMLCLPFASREWTFRLRSLPSSLHWFLPLSLPFLIPLQSLYIALQSIQSSWETETKRRWSHLFLSFSLSKENDSSLFLSFDSFWNLLVFFEFKRKEEEVSLKERQTWRRRKRVRNRLGVFFPTLILVLETLNDIVTNSSPHPLVVFGVSLVSRGLLFLYF